MTDLPEEVVVGFITYRLRKYTPKRKGEQAGHGWVREVGQDTNVPHRSEVGAEGHLLVDEIVRLRAELAARPPLPVTPTE